MASGAKDVALLALQHGDKVGAVVGAVINLAGLIVGLNKEKNKSDCILALHAGKELMKIEIELRKFPMLNGNFEHCCCALYDLIPFNTELDEKTVAEAKEIAKSITDKLLELKTYANELNAHFASCSLVETTEMMECLRHLNCACSLFEDCLKGIKKTMQRGDTPSEEEMTQFDAKYRSIALKQEGINDAFKTCSNCLSKERKN